MKKVLSLVLSCLMLLSMVCSAASYTDVPETHERYAAINMLSSMDIITGFPDGTFKPDDAVTRAQMAALITRMFNLQNSAVTAAPFSDVATDYWAVSNIVAAKNMNIINGFPDGTFQPEASVTYEQAVKMIVCALNYGTAAEALGGYPGGYIQQASKLNLLKNAASANTEPSPRGIVAQLLYNALDVEMLVPQIKADGTVDFVKPEGSGNTPANAHQNAATLKNAVVVRTPRVNLEPGVTAIESVNDNAMYVKTTAGEYVKIIVGTDTAAFDYIGQTVDVTYKVDQSNNEDKVLANITRPASVQVYENIKLSNVETIANGGITYYTDRSNDRKESLNFNGNVTVIYNNRLSVNGIATINADLNVTDNVFANGVVSVYLGNAGTLVKVKSYKTYVVDSVDSSNETIKFKGAVIGGTAQSTISEIIPYKDSYLNEVIINKGTFDYNTGAVAENPTSLSSLSGIAKGQLVSLAKNTEDASSKYYELIVSTTTQSGGITENTTDDETGRQMIKIGSGNEYYILSRDLARYEQESLLNNDTTAKFYIDAFGEIAYLDNIKAGDIRLGIPVSVATVGSGMDKQTHLKIFNVSNGNVETLLFKDEVSGDPRVAVLKDGNNELIKDSIFKYTIKSTKIDTLEPLQAGTTDYTYVAANSTATEVQNIKKESSKIKFGNGQEITYRSASDKIILIGAAGSTEEVTPKFSSMTNNSEYTGKVYQMNNKVSATSSYNIQYIIIRPYEGLVTTSPTYIVDSIGGSTYVNDINIVKIKAYAFNGTSTAGASAEAKELVFTVDVQNVLNLKKGDVFSYYDIPTTTGIHVENLRNVYIFARADEIAKGTYPTNGFMASSDNAQSASNAYNADYRYWGIRSGQSSLLSAKSNYAYAYYFGSVLNYSGEDESVLRMAVDPSNENLPILPSDTAYFADIDVKLNDGSYFFEYNIASLANIFVYDATAVNEADKLKLISGKDEVKNSYLNNLKTIEGNINDDTPRYDTILLKGYHNEDSTNTLYNLYIIKDAR